ncbi:MAG: serine hydrolase [Gammaproteobacteria bacterium]
MGTIKHIIIFFAFALGFMLDAIGAPPIPDLRRTADPVLQRRLEGAIRQLGLSRAVRDRRLAVALVDVTRVHRPRLAAVNGDEMLYAASLPKIAILFGAFVEIERGRITLDDDTRASLTRMIRVSSNEAATEMLRRVGMGRLAAILRSPRYGLYDPRYNGGLWVGKEYGRAPAWRRDPLHQLSHGATAFQTARFYYLLEAGQLASPTLTRVMKEVLSKPAIHHKFVKGLSDRPQCRMFRKSGTWRQWHSDSALIEHAGHKYIAVALAADPSGGEWMTRLIRSLDEIIVPPQVAVSNGVFR